MNAGGRNRVKSADASVAQLPQDAGSAVPAAGATLPANGGSADGDGDGDGDGDSDVASNENVAISIPMQNIRQFKETVVNTSRLLKVFNDQEKELAKAKAELARHHEEARRLQAAHQGLQRELDARARELAGANGETENARSLLALREEELSRVRGLKEDLEARVVELKQAAPAVEHNAPPKSPNVVLVEEIERLKRELEAKEGSLKSLRISRDSIRSSTKAEVMSIQARYAREQKELIDRQEKEMAAHRASLAGKEAELEQEQERLMQLEMDLGLRETQMEDQAADLKAAADKATASHSAAQQTIKRLEEQAKARGAEYRSEAARLQRKSAKDDKRVAELEAQLAKAKVKAGENARAKARPRPRSTATAAEAVQAATEDLANMTIDDLRAEVAALRVDAVHNEETIRRLQVMNAELEREQNPEGARRRPRAVVQQAQIDELTKELEIRDKKVGALEEALRLAEHDTRGTGGPGTDGGQAAARAAQLNLQVIAMEAAVKEREQAIRGLEAELHEARDAASERPMRLRNAPTPTRARRVAHTAPETADVPQGQCEQHYAEIASLRAKADRLRQEKAALQELVTEQQVKLRQLRLGPAAAPSATPTLAQRKRDQQPAGPYEAGAIGPGAVGPAALKRVKRTATQVAHEDLDLTDPVVVIAPLRKQAARPRRPAAAAPADSPDGRFAEPHEPHEIGPALLSRRILDVTRTRRFVSLAGSSPLALPTALARMPGRVPPLDSARLAELLVAQVHTHIAGGRSSEGVGLVPNAQPLSADSGRAGELGTAAARLTVLTDGMRPGLYAHEASLALSAWALVLRSEQKTLYSELMRCLSEHIVLRAGGPVAGACSLARVFAALGLLAADIQRVRAMLCDLLMEAGDSPHALPVLANALAVWPAALAMPPPAGAGRAQGPASDVWLSFGLMVRVFQAITAGIHDLYAEERGAAEADALYAIMVERCGWRQPGEAEYADALLVEVKDTLGSLDRGSGDCPVVMAAFNLLAPYVS